MEPHNPTGAAWLAEDPAYADLVELGRDRFLETIRKHPGSPLCWALLAEGALAAGQDAADVAAYAYARTGWQLGRAALLEADWTDGQAISWEHAPNQGYLRCLWALARAAGRLGEDEEAARVERELADVSPDGLRALATQRSVEGDEPTETDATIAAETTDTATAEAEASEPEAAEPEASG